MSNNNDVFVTPIKYDPVQAKQVIEAKLNPQWIKQRQQGGATLSYIGGHTVIRLLNKAFGYQWSFEVISEEVKPSLPKPMFEGWGKNRKAVLGPDGTQKMEPQPPVAKVLGRLTIPGIGIKEQWGSKVLIGGATEQESAFKSASTDALKKCASLVGIGLELYGEDEGLDTDEEVAANTPISQPVTQQQAYQAPTQAPVNESPAPTPEPKPQAQTQKQAPAGATTASNAQAQTDWDPADIQQLKDLKVIMGITDNNQLDPFVREFLDTADVTWRNVVPQNIKAFNIYLKKKADQMIQQ